MLQVGFYMVLWTMDTPDTEFSLWTAASPTDSTTEQVRWDIDDSIFKLKEHGRGKRECNVGTKKSCGWLSFQKVEFLFLFLLSLNWDKPCVDPTGIFCISDSKPAVIAGCHLRVSLRSQNSPNSCSSPET
ncbi:Serotransferrin [Manis pentadactyla]|nr:Serotransferrin [Manis pentadactyla]